MFGTYWLEKWSHGAWGRIGNVATTPKDLDAIYVIAQALADDVGGHYQIVQASHLADAPPVVIRQFIGLGAAASS